MEELAPLSILAISLFMVLSAQLGFIVGRQVLLWHEFVHVMSVGAGVPVLAMLVHDNIAAHLCFLHFLNFLVELEALLPIHESFLLGSSGGLTGEAGDIIEVVRALLERRVSRVHLRDWHVIMLVMMMVVMDTICCVLMMDHFTFCMVKTRN